MSSVAVTGKFVLPQDVLLTPMGELPPEARAGLEYTDGDHALARPLARTPAKVVSASTAALLETFREPKTLVDAIIDYTTGASLDPEQTLEDAFPTLSSLVNTGLLLPADSMLALPITASLEPGGVALGYTVERCVHVLVDTEVYLARSQAGEWAALKLARPGAERRMASVFAHEARILALLDGRSAPRSLGLGTVDGQPCLALEWCAGAPLDDAVASASGDGWEGILGLGRSVIDAYVALHRSGVLHGDVHGGNVLVGPDGTVTILDFGLGRVMASAGNGDDPGRGGVDLFLEPEYARARLEGRTPPACTPAGEQYAVAALLYHLVSGAHTHDFSLEEQPMLAQIATEAPRPLSARGVAGLEAVQGVLFRALEKDPAARHGSLEAMGSAFAAARAAGAAGKAPPSGAVEAVVAEVLERAALDGALWTEGFTAPTASLQNGAAGVAYALLRIAGIRGDDHLLGLADAWSSRARAALGAEAALTSAEHEIETDKVGHHSILHREGGVHFVSGLIAAARADPFAHAEAVHDFIASVDPADPQRDVAFGRAGVLFACAALMDGAEGDDRAALATMGDALAAGLWAELAGLEPIGVDAVVGHIGAAHGWAGLLHAQLRWTGITGADPPAELAERLDELAGLAVPTGRGLAWPRVPGEMLHDLAPSWCNGAAGLVPLWTAAAERYGEARYAALAERAAWTAYEGGPAIGDLCCGWAGRAYALVEMHRYDGDDDWLRRARTLGERAAETIGGTALRRDSLLKGDIGVALLGVELQRPDEACMPLTAWR